MRKSIRRAVALLSAAASVAAGTAACAGGGQSADDSVADTTVVQAHAAHATTEESGGDVAPDSSLASGKWLDDGNVLALLGTIDARQVDAANVELRSWHSDTVRAFATAMLGEHQAFQHRADSLAAVLRIAPLAPALSDSVSARMQAGVDSVHGIVGPAFDRAFVAAQINSDQLADSYLQGLMAVAQRPEVQALVAAAAAQTESELQRARTLKATLATSDSVRADSLSRRRTRRGQ